MPYITEERRMIQEQAREFTLNEVLPVANKLDPEKGDIPMDLREKMAELGYFGILIPEQYGGLGMDYISFALLCEELERADTAFRVVQSVHVGLNSLTLLQWATEEQKQRWLPGVHRGEAIAAFALTEPGVGSDPATLQTRAEPTADGQHFVINGEKLWCTNGLKAGVLVVMVQTPPKLVNGKERKQVTAFIVDAHAPGITLGAVEQKMGIKASDTRTVSFENVLVPVEDRLGDVGAGFKIALEILNSGRLGLAAGSSRGTRAILDRALAYAKEREQFGRPIGSFEMIQRKFAVTAAECYAADAAWMTCAAMVDRGGIDFSLETAACKVYASELAFRAACDAQQIAGGIGYSKDYPYEQAVRDSRINLIFEGTNEILRALIALSGLQQPGESLNALGKAFKDPLHSLGAIGSYITGRVKKQIVKPEFTKVHPALQDEADMVADAIHGLALAVEKCLIEHGKSIIERQFHQERMANAAIDIFFSTAALSRCTWAIHKAGSVEAAGADIDNVKVFVPMAMRRTRRFVRALEKNADGRLKALAERALANGTLTVQTPTDA